MITREFDSGIWSIADEPGVTLHVTLNPSPTQTQHFKSVRPPHFWKPIILDTTHLCMKIEQPLNRFVDNNGVKRVYKRIDQWVERNPYMRQEVDN